MSVDAKGYEEKPWWPYVLDLQEKIDAGGGGGSSDFSTATVTLVNNGTSDVVGINASLAYSENTLGEGAPATSFPSVISQISSNQSIEVTVILYKGNGVIDPSSNSSYFDMALTGDIEENGPMLIVTGDGTITFTDKA